MRGPRLPLLHVDPGFGGAREHIGVTWRHSMERNHEHPAMRRGARAKRNRETMSPRVREFLRRKARLMFQWKSDFIESQNLCFRKDPLCSRKDRCCNAAKQTLYATYPV